MATRRGKLVALSSGIVALTLAAILPNDRLWEEYYLRRLQSADEEVRLHAAESLGDLKSLRAVPALPQLIAEDPRECVLTNGPDPTGLTPMCFALYRIGPEALSYLKRLEHPKGTLFLLPLVLPLPRDFVRVATYADVAKRPRQQ